MEPLVYNAEKALERNVEYNIEHPDEMEEYCFVYNYYIKVDKEENYDMEETASIDGKQHTGYYSEVDRDEYYNIIRKEMKNQRSITNNKENVTWKDIKNYEKNHKRLKKILKDDL